MVSRTTWIVGGLFGLALMVALSKHEPAREPPLAPEQAAQKAARIAAENDALAGAKALKRAMKDPQSFELKQLLVMPDRTACYTYRATNSFNAKLQNSAVLVPGKKAQMLIEGTDGNRFVDAWNKRCTKTGEDIAPLVARHLD